MIVFSGTYCNGALSEVKYMYQGTYGVKSLLNHNVVHKCDGRLRSFVSQCVTLNCNIMLSQACCCVDVCVPVYSWQRDITVWK